MNFFKDVKKWLAEITEIALLLIALAIAVEILFGSAIGSAIPFFGGCCSQHHRPAQYIGRQRPCGTDCAGDYYIPL
ncbi:MAG: hypothetical protein FVQ79_06435 [Planctomycetes bacterium]|nr:hypothetical protein [Planctomycetota bacterium]